MTTPADDECIHGLAPATCSLCRQQAAGRSTARSRPGSGNEAPSAEDEKRRAHLVAYASAARPGLAEAGFGRFVVPTARNAFLWVLIPSGVWYRRFTQNNLVHSKVTATTVSFRMHMWAYEGQRSLNNAALDIVRQVIEEDLLEALPAHKPIDWRAAGPGGNQVMEVTTRGGVDAETPVLDAQWFVATSRIWLEIIRRHPIPNLRQLVARTI